MIGIAPTLMGREGSSDGAIRAGRAAPASQAADAPDNPEKGALDNGSPAILMKLAVIQFQITENPAENGAGEPTWKDRIIETAGESRKQTT